MNTKRMEKMIVIKPIMNPLKDIPAVEYATENHIRCLEEYKRVWNSVRELSVKASVGDSLGDLSEGLLIRASIKDSIRNSLGASVGASVGDSLGDSIMDLIRASVGDSVWASVGGSVRDSVWASVWDSVRASVRASVWASVRASVWDSVRDSVRASVGDSLYCYISSFFDIKYDYDFSPAVKLWESGIIPSFDGVVWRLHTGEDAHIIYEVKH